MVCQDEDESVPLASARSEMDELKGMLAVVIRKMNAQEQSTSEMLKSVLLAKEAR